MSLSTEVEGFVHAIFNEQQVSEKFKKRDFVLHVPNAQSSNYDDYIQIQTTGDRCAKLDEVSVGGKIKAFLNIRGKEYDKKDGSGKGYFNTIECWKFEVLEKAQSKNDYGLEQNTGVVPEVGLSGNTSGNDDLPF